MYVPYATSDVYNAAKGVLTDVLRSLEDAPDMRIDTLIGGHIMDYEDWTLEKKNAVYMNVLQMLDELTKP